jgi:hypothetical protein
MADLYFCDPGDVVSPFKLVGNDPTVISPGAVEVGFSVSAELVFAPCTETMSAPGCGTLDLLLRAVRLFGRKPFRATEVFRCDVCDGRNPCC